MLIRPDIDRKKFDRSSIDRPDFQMIDEFDHRDMSNFFLIYYYRRFEFWGYYHPPI